LKFAPTRNATNFKGRVALVSQTQAEPPTFGPRMDRIGAPSER